MSFSGIDELSLTSASGLARLVRTKKISPRELVDAFISKIEAENPAINAVAVDRFERAREEAKSAEERLARSEGSIDAEPLFGVPCTIKEGIAVEGMPNSAGVFARKNIRAERDAVVVRRLRDAGAIVLGVTNMAEAECGSKRTIEFMVAPRIHGIRRVFLVVRVAGKRRFWAPELRVLGLVPTLADRFESLPLFAAYLAINLLANSSPTSVIGLMSQGLWTNSFARGP